jgi:hypothetical protein
MGNENLKALLRTFIRGQNRSLGLAGEIESAISKAFPEDEDLDDFENALALYSPGGGDFLYGEHTIVKWCEWLLAKLE